MDSSNCLIILILIAEVTFASWSNTLDSKYACKPGDEIRNERVKCSCSLKHVYDCSLVNEVNYPYEYSKHSTKYQSAKTGCHSNKIYVQNGVTCICNKNGTWPHTKCAAIFKNLPHKAILRKCTPNSYIRIDCNICRCNSKGDVDEEYCTRNKCDDNTKKIEHRRSNRVTKLYGSCEVKTWYSLAPCQFCYCINRNKLLCNTGSYENMPNGKLQLGVYKFNVCGMDLLAEALEISDEKVSPSNSARTRNTKSQSREASEQKNEKLDSYDDISLDDEVAQADLKNQLHLETDIVDDEEGKELEESETISIEETKPIVRINSKVQEKEHGSTQQPFQEEDLENTESVEDDYNKNGKVYDGNDNDGLQLQTTTEAITKTQNVAVEVTDKSTNSEWDFNNLPNVLDKILRLTVRKSMVSFDDKKKCVPGSVDVVECNTCFCLKNSKLLCTNNKCN